MTMDDPARSSNADSPIAGSPVEGSSTSQPDSSPASSPTQLGRFYRVDSSHSTFGELWRDTRSPLVLIAWFTKILGIKLPGTVNEANVVSLRPFLVRESEATQRILAEYAEKLRPIITELADLGFVDSGWFWMDDLFHHAKTAQLVMRHREGQSIVRVTYRIEGLEQPKPRDLSYVEFLSDLSDGSMLLSSSNKAQLLTHARCRLNWRAGATVSQLWVSHREQLQSIEQEGVRPVGVRSRESMLAMLDKHHEAVRDYLLSRGVFSSMSGADLKRAEAIDHAAEQAQRGELEHPDVFAQLDILQNKKGNWSDGLLVLFVSIAIFIGAGKGAWNWSWEMLVSIVIVLFVHELGHLLAMKIFGYRNVRMFFIPLFGAAVSGTNYTAPGWKKVIVALAGPLPGILLGGALAVVGVMKGQDWMVRAGNFAILLNVFQLLPVLPLDGGRVMQAVLFSRHHMLDTIFGVFAGVAMAALGAALGSTILILLGVFMLAGLRIRHTLGAIAGGLRKQATPLATAAPVSPAVTRPATWQSGLISEPAPTLGGPTRPAEALAIEDVLPRSTASRIIEQIKTRLPKIKSPKQIASLTMQVYERLATRPPGATASVGFLFLQGGSFLAGLVVVLVLVVVGDPAFRNSFNEYSLANRVVRPGDVEVWSAELPAPSGASSLPPALWDGESVRLVIHHRLMGLAAENFHLLKKEAPEGVYLVRFGQSILVSMAAAMQPEAERWFDRFDAQAEKVYLETGHDFTGTMHMKCTPGSEMSSTDVAQVKEQLNVPSGLCLAQPWLAPALLPPEMLPLSKYTKARTLSRQLENAWAGEEPEIAALYDQLDRADRLNKQDEYDRIEAEITKKSMEATVRVRRNIRDAQDDPALRALADQWMTIAAERDAAAPDSEGEDAGAEAIRDRSWESTLERYEQERATIGESLGVVPMDPKTGMPPTRIMRYLLTSSYAYEDPDGKLMVSMSFYDISHGAPAVLLWLEEQGCEEFAYDYYHYGMER